MILLVAVNAGYAHSSFSLRCLWANMGALSQDVRLIEVDGECAPVELCERLLAAKPAQIGFSVYIWNYTYVVSVMRMLKQIAPEVRLVVGGPHIVPGDEVAQEIFEVADCAVVGEAEGVAEEVFCNVAQAPSPVAKSILDTAEGGCATLENIALPYSLYTDEDIAHRILYVETSRGCPFKCMYCTSAGQSPIRFFPLEKVLGALDGLIRRGARRLKFLDRSFNHNGEQGLAVLDFLLRETECLRRKVHGTDRNVCDTFQFHFEFTPYTLTAAWKERLCRFAPGELHIEVGVQTLNADVAAGIHRPCPVETAEETLRFLIHEAKADVHADIIVGLPGETAESIRDGFNRLVALRPAEIQVGILKRLPGTELARRSRELGLCFSGEPPYEILRTDTLSFEALCRLKRFAQCWDRLYNRRRFPTAMGVLLEGSTGLLTCAQNTENTGQKTCATFSPFEKIMAVAEWIHERHGRFHALSPKQLAEALSAVEPSSEMVKALEADARRKVK